MRLQAYKDFKATNAEWLGDVPKHWNTKRLKMSAGLRDRKVEADPDEPMPYIGLENIESWTGRLLPIDDSVVPAGTANAFDKKHTLFGKLRPYLAKACNPKFDGLCSTELLVLQSVDLDRRNLLYSLLSDGFIKLVDSSTFGSKMPRANWEFIGNCIVPIPPPNEQRAIADFLDRETGKIDMLVGKKWKLIEKLKEKRIALISRTVTKGLPAEAAAKAGFNPHPKLKASGIEWLGDVPEHWDVMRLKWRARCQSGEGIAPDEVSPDQSAARGIPVIGGNGVMGYCDTSNCDDPVVVIGRVGALCGNVHCIKPPVWVTDNALLMPIDARVFRLEYLAAVLRSRNLNELADKTAQPLITGTRVRSEMIPIPPAQEQHAIANYLDRETAKIDKMIEKVEAAIEKLQEYRTALITAAVTGKIDVRGEANSVGSTGALAAGTLPA